MDVKSLDVMVRRSEKYYEGNRNMKGCGYIADGWGMRIHNLDTQRPLLMAMTAIGSGRF